MPPFSRCVVFDLDDTLFLERDYVRSGFEAVGRWVRSRLGIEDFADEAWRLFESGHRTTIFDVVLTQNGVEPTTALVDRLVRVYRTHEPCIRLLPDAQGCVGALHDQVSLAVVSDGPLESQERKYRALGIARLFDVVVFTQAMGSDFAKPHPGAFRYVQSRVQLPPDALVYVADNPHKDFMAPITLGWKTIRVRRRHSLHFSAESPPGSEPGMEIADLSSLAGTILRIGP